MASLVPLSADHFLTKKSVILISMYHHGGMKLQGTKGVIIIIEANTFVKNWADVKEKAWGINMIHPQRVYQYCHYISGLKSSDQ